MSSTPQLQDATQDNYTTVHAINSGYLRHFRLESTLDAVAMASMIATPDPGVLKGPLEPRIELNSGSKEQVSQSYSIRLCVCWRLEGEIGMLLQSIQYDSPFFL